MDTKAKTQWLADLRSGNFNQTTSDLRNQKGFCCLGVLANQFSTEWVGNLDRMVPVCNGKLLSDGSEGSDMSGYLSDDFINQVGLNKDLVVQLMELNDNGNSFAVIADKIEAEA